MIKKNIVHIAQTKDGFISGPNDDLSFLEKIELGPEGLKDEELDTPRVMRQTDIIICGRKTYDYIIKSGVAWPYPDHKTYVVTHGEIDDKNVEVFSGSITKLAKRAKYNARRGVWIMGGADIIQQYIRTKHVDEISLVTIDTEIGEGVKLFDNRASLDDFKLVDSKSVRNFKVEIYKNLI